MAEIDGGSPHPPERAQVEGGGQYGPFGRHVGEAAQQKLPRPLLHLDDSEDRFDQLLSQLVSLFRCWGGHPGTMAT